MAEKPTNGTVVSFGNTPQAKDDNIAGLGTEDTGSVLFLDVLANDLAGKAKTLWSVDDGISQGGDRPVDLLTQDAIGAVNTTALGGELWITADGRVAYRMTEALRASLQSLALGETASDSFTYAIQMGNGTLSWARVNFTVSGTNDTPVVQNVSIAAVEDGAAVTGSFNGDDVDSDDDAGTLQYTLTAQPAVGALTNNANGTFTYEPGSNFQELAAGETSSQSFTYTATDKHGAVSAPANGAITVTGVNDAPTMQSATAAAVEDGNAVTVDLAALGGDIDSDDDGNTLTYTVLGAPASGSAAISGNTLSFDPGADFQGLALGETQLVTLAVEAKDKHGATAVNTVAVTVTGVNDAPTLQAASLSANEDDASVSLNLAPLGDDVDFDDHGGSLTYAVYSQSPPLGSAAVSGTTLTFTPGNDLQSLAAGEQQDVFIKIQATDHHGASAFNSVVVTVTGANDAPFYTGGAASGAVNALPAALVPPTTLNTGGTVQFADVDLSDTHTITVGIPFLTLGNFNASVTNDSTGTGNGTVAWNYAVDNNTVAYLAAGEHITNTYLLNIHDGKGGTAQQQVDVQVFGVNDAPVITSGTDQAKGNTMEDTALTVSGQVTISDLDNTDTHSWSIASNTSGAYGSASVDSNGKWTYAVANGTNGVASAVQSLAQGQTVIETFTVRASDGNGGNADQIVHVVVAGINDAAVITPQSSSITETNAAQSTGGTLTLSDIDSPQTFNAQNSAGKYGNLALGADGKWVYAMNGAHNEFEQGKNYVDTFNVTAIDGTQLANAITVTIAGTNDAPTAVNDLGALKVTSLASQVNTTTVKWVDWTQASAGQVSGVINLGGGQTIGVTYSGDYTFAQTNGGNNYYTTGPAVGLGTGTYTSAGVANGPTGSDIIALQLPTQRTLTFSQPVDDLFFAVVSLNGNGYRFDQDFDILSYGQGFFGNGSAVKTALPNGQFELLSVPTPGVGIELHGVIGIKGSVTSLTWNSLSNEWWNGFTIGTYGKAQTAVATGNLLGNDTDVENNALSVSVVNGQAIAGNSVTQTLASGARVTVNKNGTYSYDENGAFAKLGANETFNDTFTYVAQDSLGALSNTATATLIVTGINDAPVFAGGDITGAVTAGGASAPFKVEQFTGYGGSFSDASLHAWASSHAPNYTVFTGVIDYTDDPGGFSGEIPGSTPWPAAVATGTSGTGGINDQFFARITAQLNVTATDTYTFRTYNDDGVYLRVNNQLIISDSSHHPEAPFTGSIHLAPGTYPVELFYFEGGGEASLEFTFKGSTGGYEHVTTGAVADSGVLQFSDVDLTDTHTVSVAASGTTLGALTAAMTKDSTGSGTGGQVTWDYVVANSALTPLGAGQSKVENFDVTVNDGKGGTATQQVSVTVTGVNDGPKAKADSAAGNEDSAITIAVLANDTDPDNGDTLSLSGVTNGANGTVTMSGNNAVYQPKPNFVGTDSFSYTVTDAAGATSSATATVIVNPVPDTYDLANIVTNGSFEDGISGWLQYGGGIDVVGDWQTTDGTKTVDLNAFTKGGAVQTLATVPGQIYSASFVLSQNPGETGTSIVRVNAGNFVNDYAYNDTNTPADMKWQQKNFSFLAGGATTDISFTSLTPLTNVGHPGNAQGPAIDEVVVVANQTVNGFMKGLNGDVLNLNALLGSIDAPHDASAFGAGYLVFAQSGNNTVVAIDPNGGGNSYMTVATLVGVVLTSADTGNYLL